MIEGAASVVGTWRFSAVGVDACAALVRSGGDALACVERGITAVELDPAVTSAGFGGLPNAAGVLQLDGGDAALDAGQSVAAGPYQRRALPACSSSTLQL
jgi:isoaspartyl peptidase/L-asparaginase-like protein (Ntn-hydrolase superfamily)